jgi:hypothetical protein
MRVVALASTVVVGSGIFLWARALGGSLAGWASVLLAGALGPLTHLPRMLTLYPLMIASIVLAAAAVAHLLTDGRARAAGLAGLALGWLCLVDARGVVFAAFFTLAGLLVLRGRAPRVALLAPLAVAWALGSFAYPGGATPLSTQLDSTRVVQLARMVGDASIPPPPPPAREDPADAFVFGMTPLHLVPARLWDLARTDGSVPAGVVRPSAEARFSRHILPLVPVAGGAVFLALWGLRRERRRLAVATLLWVPFAVGLSKVLALSQLETEARFYTLLMPALAVMLGLAWPALLELGAKLSTASWALRWSRWWSVQLAVLTLVLMGWVPSALSLKGQVPWTPVTEELVQLRGESPPDRATTCAAHLR